MHVDLQKTFPTVTLLYEIGLIFEKYPMITNNQKSFYNMITKPKKLLMSKIR